jgi:hypothetical protein
MTRVRALAQAQCNVAVIVVWCWMVVKWHTMGVREVGENIWNY